MKYLHGSSSNTFLNVFQVAGTIDIYYLTEVWNWQEFLQFRQELPCKELHVCVIVEAIFIWKNLLRRTKFSYLKRI